MNSKTSAHKSFKAVSLTQALDIEAKNEEKRRFVDPSLSDKQKELNGQKFASQAMSSLNLTNY